MPGRDRHACGYPKGVWSLWARSAVSDGAARRSGATHNTSCVSMAPSGRTHAQRRAILAAIERSRTPTRTLTNSCSAKVAGDSEPAGRRSFASARCCMARICTRGAAWRAGRRACGRGGPARSRRCARPSAGRSKHAQHERASSARSSGAIVGRDRRARSSGANAAARVCMSAGAHDILTEPCCCRGGAAA